MGGLAYSPITLGAVCSEQQPEPPEMGWKEISRGHETHGHSMVRARNPESRREMGLRGGARGSRKEVEPLGWYSVGNEPGREYLCGRPTCRRGYFPRSRWPLRSARSRALQP